jgi:CHAT domain-containing protein
MHLSRRRAVALSAAVALTTAVAVAQPQTPAASPSATATALVIDGFARVNEGRFDDARSLFDRAIAIAHANGLGRIEAEAHRGVGRVLAEKGEFAASREALDRSLAMFEAIDEHAGVGQVWNQIGTTAYLRQRWEEAEAAYRRSAAAFETAGLPRDLANALRNLTFLPTIAIDERLRLIAEAHDLAVSTGDLNLQGASLHQWGDLLVLNTDYAAAMRKLDASRAILETHGNAAQLARLYTSIGRIYRLHGEPESALPYYERALERQRTSRDVAGQVQTLNAMALAQHALYRTQDAGASYMQALATAKEGAPPLVPFIQRQLGIFYIETGRVPLGVEMLEAALKDSLTPAERAHVLGTLTTAYVDLGRLDAAARVSNDAMAVAESSTDLEVRRSVRISRARMLRAAGRTVDALDDLRESLRATEQIRPNLVPADAFRLGFGERVRHQFDFAVSLFTEAGRTDEAFLAAEQGRARAFRDLLASQGLAAATAAVASLEQLTAVASRLDSTVIAYWVTGDACFVWVLERNGTIHERMVPVPAARLNQLVAATASGGSSWRELYDLIVLPIRRWLPAGDGARLTIVPDGPLNRVSFAALRNERGRYLLEGYRIHYSSALSVLALTAGERSAGGSPDRMLLVASPTLEPAIARAHHLAPLPGAAREAAIIQRLKPAAVVDVLSGSEATESRVRAGAASEGLLHFAAHGVVRDDHPMESFLALAGQAGDDATDGRLTAREIHGLTLHASLIVLSACRSAGGKVTGDGIVGLTRAFMSAGVPSVVASAWDLPDEAAPWIFERFYRARSHGSRTDGALRDAQLALLGALRNGTFVVDTRAGRVSIPEQPAVWAGLQLWGEPDGRPGKSP